MINKLLPLFPSFIPPHYLKNSKVVKFPLHQILYIQRNVLKENFILVFSFLISALGAYLLSPLGSLLGQLRSGNLVLGPSNLWSNSIFPQSYSLTHCSHHTALQLVTQLKSTEHDSV